MGTSLGTLIAHSHRKPATAVSPSTKPKESKPTQESRSNSVQVQCWLVLLNALLTFTSTRTVSCSSRLLWEAVKLVLYEPCEKNAYGSWVVCSRGADHVPSTAQQCDSKAPNQLVTRREVLDNMPHCDFWSLLFVDSFWEVRNFRMKIHSYSQL